MILVPARRISLLLVLVGAASACGGHRPNIISPSGVAPSEFRAVSHVKADVEFMQGMIPHHAQAVLISGWAEERSSRQDVRVLAQRIVVAQRDEIALMRAWLTDRGLPTPAADATHHRMTMNGMQHDMLMPGMLTDAELAQLRAARGAEFDRLFLTFMIRHHEGALVMVEELHKAPGAGQEETVFRLAADVYADQTTEIDRMQSMLATIPSGGRTP